MVLAQSRLSPLTLTITPPALLTQVGWTRLDANPHNGAVTLRFPLSPAANVNFNRAVQALNKMTALEFQARPAGAHGARAAPAPRRGPAATESTVTPPEAPH